MMCSDAGLGGAQGQVGGAASEGDKRHAVQIHQERRERLAGLHHRSLSAPKARRRRCRTFPRPPDAVHGSATIVSRVKVASAPCQPSDAGEDCPPLSYVRMKASYVTTSG